MIKDNFLNYLSHEKRYSNNTVLAYNKDLEIFSAYLQDQYEIEDILLANYSIIRQYVVYLMEIGKSATTVTRQISTLRSFYKFAISIEQLEVNPMKNIISPKTKKTNPIYIEEQKMVDLLEKYDFGEGFAAYRDKLIVSLLYQTGIRRAELISITIGDVSDNTIKVLGKRNKERIIPFCDELKYTINKYLELREKEIGSYNNGDYFFITNKSKPLYPQFVYRVVDKVLTTITSGKKSPHILRHTFATLMLNNGADLNSIKELLGHASLSATQVYTHNSVEQLKLIYNNSHPRDNNLK